MVQDNFNSENTKFLKNTQFCVPFGNVLSLRRLLKVFYCYHLWFSVLYGHVYPLLNVLWSANKIESSWVVPSIPKLDS